MVDIVEDTWWKGFHGWIIFAPHPCYPHNFAPYFRGTFFAKVIIRYVIFEICEETSCIFIVESKRDNDAYWLNNKTFCEISCIDRNSRIGKDVIIQPERESFTISV